ncbi:hypothetical protein GCM10023085_23740 [Actinomadura viridis]|uniref:Uncharacterized protein n=1 Tax=Actinomadura viridis TaxID=58110 RepID=A0A931GMR2_9ACTN|nr:hypothetical protein [Actinomadura viridis]MBG6088746.1 hypothetical protein [Actinomadura viridis]
MFGPSFGADDDVRVDSGKRARMRALDRIPPARPRAVPAARFTRARSYGCEG